MGIEMDQAEVSEEFVIDSIDTLKALSHELRLTLMRQFRRPQTVKQVAEVMGKAPTALYYHVKLLEEQGLLLVTDTKLVSGILEKTYRAAARRFRIEEGLLSGAAQPDRAAAAVLEMMFATTRQELHQNLMAAHSDQSVAKNHMVRVQYHLTKAEATAFGKKLMALIDEYDAFTEPRPQQETALYNLTSLFFPVIKPDSEQK